MSFRPADAVFLPLLGVAAGFYLVGAILLFLHRRRPRPEPDERTPVTVLKPLAGAFPGLRPALETFFRQTHRQYQIAVGVRSADDPACAVVEELRRAYPGVDCQVVIAGPDLGPNRKVTNLHYTMSVAKYDLILIADDDVSVPADYVARMAGELRDPEAGVATSPYRVDPRGLVLALDGLTRATEFLPSVAVAERLEGGLSFSLGASSIFRRAAIDAIGGLGACADHLAEDYLLGARARREGWRVRLSTEAVDLRHDFVTMRDYLSHQFRWSRTYRFCRPLGFFLSVLTHGVTLSLLYVLAAGAGETCLAAASSLLALRLLTAAGDVLLAGRRSLLRWIPLVPLRDLLSTAFWASSFLGRTVRWRGRAFRLAAGGRLKMAE